MAPAKSRARTLAEEACKKFPEASSLSLARKLRKEHPLHFASVETARGFVRYARGAHGETYRHCATTPKKLGKAGEAPKCPPSLAEAWEPFKLEGAKRIGSISDVHIPYHSKLAFEAAVSDLQASKIDTLLINGDFADFYQVSRHQRDPSYRSFATEVQIIKEALTWLRSKFRKARIVYKLGNHEERWNHFIWNRAPEIYNLANVQIDSLLEFQKFGIEMVGDQRPIMAGKLPICHGHELGRSIFSPVNPARGAFIRTHHTILVGHSHQTSSHADTDLWHSETHVWSQGCLCDLTPAYARINRWNWGHALIEVANDESFNVSNRRISRQGKVRSA